MRILLICIAVLLIALVLLQLPKERKKKRIPLMLTKKIYAVPGLECNIYFNNIVSVINYKNYAFDVKCKIGRTDSARWRVIPSEKDIGEHKISICVYDDDGLAGEGETTLVVVPPVAEKKSLSLLLIGASQTGAVGYPERIWELMKQENNVDFSMIGSNSGGYAKPVPGGVAHEGYGGWGWNSFFVRWGIDESDKNDGLHPRRPWVCNSRFLFPDGDSFKFDLKQYMAKYNSGKAPDVVVIMLGINNIFAARSNQDVDKTWDEDIYPYMKRMVEEFRKLNPDIRIAFTTLTPGAFSQDAFGASYKNEYNLWQWRKNHAYYHLHKLPAAVREFNVDLIPVHAVVDGDHGYPEKEEPANQRSETMISRQSNGLHPNLSGYRQIGDCIFGYLKSLLAAK